MFEGITAMLQSLYLLCSHVNYQGVGGVYI